MPEIITATSRLLLLQKEQDISATEREYRRGWESALLGKRAQRYDKPNVGNQKNGATA
jgi:hypothetical protein